MREEYTLQVGQDATEHAITLDGMLTALIQECSCPAERRLLQDPIVAALHPVSRSRRGGDD
jgi:hypothetical protein